MVGGWSQCRTSALRSTRTGSMPANTTAPKQEKNEQKEIIQLNLLLYFGRKKTH